MTHDKPWQLQIFWCFCLQQKKMRHFITWTHENLITEGPPSHSGHMCISLLLFSPSACNLFCSNIVISGIIPYKSQIHGKLLWNAACGMRTAFAINILKYTLNCINKLKKCTLMQDCRLQMIRCNFHPQFVFFAWAVKECILGQKIETQTAGSWYKRRHSSGSSEAKMIQ